MKTVEDTDHDHLGKLITYASGKGADVVIWVVKHAREEHKAAVEWLNNHTDDKIGFFLCEIKIVSDWRFTDSTSILQLLKDQMTGQRKSEKQRQPIQPSNKDWNTGRHFNDYAFSDANFSRIFNKRKPTTDHWMDFSIGSSACHIAVSQKRKAVDVELYINDDKELFKSLFAHKEK